MFWNVWSFLFSFTFSFLSLLLYLHFHWLLRILSQWLLLLYLPFRWFLRILSQWLLVLYLHFRWLLRILSQLLLYLHFRWLLRIFSPLLLLYVTFIVWCLRRRITIILLRIHRIDCFKIFHRIALFFILFWGFKLTPLHSLHGRISPKILCTIFTLTLNIKYSETFINNHIAVRPVALLELGEDRHSFVADLEGTYSRNYLEVGSIFIFIWSQFVIKIKWQIRFWDLIFQNNCIGNSINDGSRDSLEKFRELCFVLGMPCSFSVFFGNFQLQRKSHFLDCANFTYLQVFKNGV